MKICINVKGFAYIQKLIGWAIVVMAIHSGFEVFNIMVLQDFKI